MMIARTERAFMCISRPMGAVTISCLGIAIGSRDGCINMDTRAIRGPIRDRDKRIENAV